MEFYAALRVYGPQIDRLAHRVYIPGMDYDDVRAEMQFSLWRASTTYDLDGDVPFGAYWWKVWENRRNDLTAKALARKRPVTVPTNSHKDRPYWMPERLDPPPGTSPIGSLVWRLLATGETGTEARSLTALSKRAYYDLIRSWRTQEVRDTLRD